MDLRAKPPSRTVENLLAGNTQHLVVYGTSLTAKGPWVGQVASVLDRFFPGLARVTNSGESAMWSQWGVEHLDERVLAHEPDAVLIEFAINDAFLPYETSVAQARANLETMIDRIRRANDEGEIFLMTMNPPIGEHRERRPDIDACYQMVRDVAAEHRTELIDTHPAWVEMLENDPDEFDRCVPDGVHPNAQGSATITTPAVLSGFGVTPADRRRGC